MSRERAVGGNPHGIFEGGGPEGTMCVGVCGERKCMGGCMCDWHEQQVSTPKSLTPLTVIPGEKAPQTSQSLIPSHVDARHSLSRGHPQHG